MGEAGRLHSEILARVTVSEDQEIRIRRRKLEGVPDFLELSQFNMQGGGYRLACPIPEGQRIVNSLTRSLQRIKAGVGDGSAILAKIKVSEDQEVRIRRRVLEGVPDFLEIAQFNMRDEGYRVACPFPDDENVIGSLARCLQRNEGESDADAGAPPMRDSLRCGVCGRVLGLVQSSAVRFGVVFCPDRACRLYPPLSTSRSSDLTMGPYIQMVLENTDVNAFMLGRLFGRKESMQAAYSKQRARWER